MIYSRLKINNHRVKHTVMHSLLIINRLRVKEGLVGALPMCMLGLGRMTSMRSRHWRMLGNDSYSLSMMLNVNMCVEFLIDCDSVRWNIHCLFGVLIIRMVIQYLREFCSNLPPRKIAKYITTDLPYRCGGNRSWSASRREHCMHTMQEIYHM